MTPKATTDAFLVNVPSMHSDTAGLPAGVKLMDPGLAPEPDAAKWFTPADLPMDRQVVAAMLAQFNQLARESRGVADVSAFASGLSEDFHSGTSFAIRDEITAADDPEAARKERTKALSRAQTELCLAWALEESAHDLRGLEDTLDSQWANFELTLGMEPGDAIDDDGLGLVEGKPSLAPSTPKAPVTRVIDAILAFLPSGCGLFSQDKALRADWEEFGVVFAPATPNDLLRFGLEGEGWLKAEAEGYRLCLMRRADAGKPWQAAPFAVLLREEGAL